MSKKRKLEDITIANDDEREVIVEEKHEEIPEEKIEEKDEGKDEYLKFILSILDIFIYDEFDSVEQVKERALSVRESVLTKWTAESFVTELPTGALVTEFKVESIVANFTDDVSTEEKFTDSYTSPTKIKTLSTNDVPITKAPGDHAVDEKNIDEIHQSKFLPYSNTTEYQLKIPDPIPNIWDYRLPSDKSSIPKCHCNENAVEKHVIKNNENHGRLFWTCELQFCKFFQWLD